MGNTRRRSRSIYYGLEIVEIKNKRLFRFRNSLLSYCDELDVVGELISNLYGALEVKKMTREGKDQKEALNEFMKRVMGSIDK